MNFKGNIAGLLALSLLGLSACASSSDSSSSGSAANSSTSQNAPDSSASDSSELITLSLWHYYNASTKDVLDVYINQFNDTVGAEKNIKVEAISYSSVDDLASAVVNAANKEVGVADMPNLFAAYSDIALLLHELELVVPLDDYFSEEELSLFHQDFLAEGRFTDEESLMILPVAKSTELLFINETDFTVFAEATGASLSQLSTWEGLAEVAETYYNWTDEETPDISGDGRALFGLDSEANFMLVAATQLGEEIYRFGDDGTVEFALTTEGARKIWDTVLVPYIKGHYAAEGSYRSDNVKAGDLLIYAGSTSSVNYFPTTVELGRTETYDISGTAMAYPYFESGKKVAVQQGAGMMMSRTDEAQHEASVEFLKWLSTSEQNLNFAVNTGYIPVQQEALSYEMVLEVMEENGTVSDMLETVADVTYHEVMADYEFYASTPFHGSYDCRSVLQTSILTAVSGTSSTLDAWLEEGRSYDDAVALMIGDEAFGIWYDTLKTDIEAVLAEN